MKGSTGARPPLAPRGGNSNAVIQKRIVTAQKQAKVAQARVDLEVAKATVAGKKVEYDYSGPGDPKVRVKSR